MFKVYYLKVCNWCYLTKTKCVTQLWATTISFQCALSINSRHISRVFSQKKWLLLQLIIVLKLKDIMKESRLSEALRMKRYYSSWGSETIEFVDDSNLLPCKFSIFIISYVISCSSYNLTTQSLNGISKSNIWFGIYLKISSFKSLNGWQWNLSIEISHEKKKTKPVHNFSYFANFIVGWPWPSWNYDYYHIWTGFYKPIHLHDMPYQI